MKTSTAISVIGGADGPTSVFIAGKIGNDLLMAAAIGGFLIIALIGYCFWKSHK